MDFTAKSARRKLPTLLPLVAMLVGAVAAHGAGPTIKEFALPTAVSPSSLTTGPDGNLWFIQSATQVGVLTTAGTLKDTITLPQPPNTFFPPFFGNLDARNNIVTGPDGNLWFCEGLTQKIARLTPSGAITEFAVPTSDAVPSSPASITAGPDGALWFTDIGTLNIGRITTDGAITEYPLVHGDAPLGITAGPDGNLWFANVSSIGRITPQGAITRFPLPTDNPFYDFAQHITRGPDGDLWFTSSVNDGLSVIGKITTAGAVTLYPLTDSVAVPEEIVAGPDGNLWFTENRVGAIGSITTSGVVAEYPTPTAGSGPYGITVGPDGNLWFTEPYVRKIARAKIAGGACVANATTLCIDEKPNDRRWELSTTFATTQGGAKAGNGSAISLGSLGVTKGGLFWFFDATNPEMLLKLIDGCGLNQHFWVFYAATTNVGFEVAVRDTRSGVAKTYTNLDGSAATPIQDTTAFPCLSGDSFAPDQAPAPLAMPAMSAMPTRPETPQPDAEEATCTPSATHLCLDGRFSIQTAYHTAQGGGSAGDGHALSLQSLGVGQGGMFWFFDPTNPEMLVKVIDACALNDHFWVFYAATTNVGLTVTVTDAKTGHKHQYTNDDGHAAAPIQDTAALPCP